jgi:lysozyme family protein
MTINKHFLAAMARTMKTEGGYTTDGPTYRGIDRRYWGHWPGWALVDAWKAGEITSEKRDTLLEPEVRHFYLVNFWHRINGDRLAAISPEVAAWVFDKGVNQDAPDGVRYLQDALNLLNRNQKLYPDIIVDGRPGPITLDRFRRYMESAPPSIEMRRALLLNVLASLYQCRIIAWMRADPTREEYRGLLLR